MRFVRPPFAAAACVALLAAVAPAQDGSPEFEPDLEPGLNDAAPMGGSLSEADLDRLADALADRIVDRLADRLADRIADKLVPRLGGLNEDGAADEIVRRRIAALIGQMEPAAQRTAYATVFAEAWPERAPLDRHAAGLAVTLEFLGQRLPAEAGYDAFALAAELATRALEANAAPQTARESFDAVFFYAACGHARDGEHDAAFADLDRAFEFGFTNFDLLNDDPDLEALRAQPGFPARLARWKRAVRETAAAAAKAALAAGKSYPLAFAFTDLAGKTHRLADYQGEAVIVAFWGTWCAPA